MEQQKFNICPEIPYFGARYPDATCIDGFLWDLDSCDEPGGGLSIGGDIPCPFCNTSAFIDHHRLDTDDPVICSTYISGLVTKEKLELLVNELKQKYNYIEPSTE